jgi:CRP-like cAMP-binding protein
MINMNDPRHDLFETAFDSPWVVDGTPWSDFLQDIGREQSFAKNSYIYQMGDPGKRFFYLQEGRVKIITANEQGEEKTLSVLEPGNFFGETSFFDQRRRFATAMAVADSRVISLNINDFNKILHEESHETIRRYMFMSLSRKIRLLSKQVEDLTFWSIEKRLCRFLWKMLADFNMQTEKGLALSLILTDDQIGHHIGARREAVTKVLNKLKNLGIIKKENRRLYFPDLEALKKYI